jgi:Big-like domain-containing protein
MVQLPMRTCRLARRPCTRYTVLRYTVLALLGLGFSCGVVACAPTLVGPTVPSGYFLSMEVSTPIIWLGASTAGRAEQFPTMAEVSVRVQDKQGQPVDGVPVTFEVEPDWAQYASVSPSQGTTRGGVARTVFAARLSGVVHITARVDNTTARTRITVLHYGGPPPSSE